MKVTARARDANAGVATSFVVTITALLATIITGPFDLGSEAQAKTPGKTYCFYGKCHRVKTISETQNLVGETISLHSSHYDSCHKDRYNPCGLTSSGEPFFADRPDNAASPIYPDGTKLLVWSPSSKEAAVIRINNAGPYWGNRKLDVSRSLARTLGFEKRGVAKLETRVLSAPTRAEARYKRNRRYEKVQGPLGQFDSLDEAEKGLAVLLAFEAMTTAALAPSAGGAVSTVKKPFQVAANVDEARVFAAIRPQLKSWPVVTQRFASINWPVVSEPKKRTSGKLSRIASLDDAAIAWPVVQRAKSVALSRPSKHKRKNASASGSVKKSKSGTSKRQAKPRRLQKSTKKKVRRKAVARSNFRVKSRQVKSRTTVKRPVKAKTRPYVAVRTILHRALGRTAI